MNKKKLCFLLCGLILLTGCTSVGDNNDTNTTKEIYTYESNETDADNDSTTNTKEDITKETTQCSTSNKETETSV